jgi:alpha-galactosidase/6-phospho-beta-glucosidase family protein
MVTKKFISSPKVKKTISILKHKNPNTIISKHSDIAFSNPLINNSYDELVQKTVEWIKSRESINQFVNYQENNETVDTEIAEKLLMNAILTNYQLKRDILNDLLTKAPDKKEALDYVMNSKEWEQMQQFENWTAEFLKKHPQHFEPTTTIASLNARLIVY